LQTLWPFPERLAKFLSLTGGPVHVPTVQNLLRSGAVDAYCDHMRCWDGGAAFFTCRYGTYHLDERFGHVESVDGKLVSTDYSSVYSPFYRYWNGDYCDIGPESKCLCGRTSRQFRLTCPELHHWHGEPLAQWKERLKGLRLRQIRHVSL